MFHLINKRTYIKQLHYVRIFFSFSYKHFQIRKYKYLFSKITDSAANIPCYFQHLTAQTLGQELFSQPSQYRIYRAIGSREPRTVSIWHYSHLLCHSRSSTCRSRVLHKRLSGIFHLSAFRSQPKLARIMRQPLNPRLRAASNLPLFTRRFCLSAPYPLSRLSRPRFLRAQRSLRIGGGKKARRRLYIYRAAWWLQSFIVSGRGLDAARDF